MIRLCQLVLITVLALVVPAQVWADTAPEAQCTLRVGWGEWYPFIYKTEGKFFGSEYDLLQQLASKAGCQLVYIERTWEDSLKLLAEGQLDMLYGATRTAEREAYANFSASYRVEQIVLVMPVGQVNLEPEKTTISLGRWLDQKNASGQPRKLGLVTAYYFGDELEKILRAESRQSQLVQMPFDQQLHKQMIQGLLDGYLVEAAVVQNLRGAPVNWMNVQEYKTAPLHLMFSKKVPQAIVDRFDKAIGKD